THQAAAQHRAPTTWPTLLAAGPDPAPAGSPCSGAPAAWAAAGNGGLPGGGGAARPVSKASQQGQSAGKAVSGTKEIVRAQPGPRHGVLGAVRTGIAPTEKLWSAASRFATTRRRSIDWL